MGSCVTIIRTRIKEKQGPGKQDENGWISRKQEKCKITGL